MSPVRAEQKKTARAKQPTCSVRLVCDSVPGSVNTGYILRKISEAVNIMWSETTFSNATNYVQITTDKENPIIMHTG